MDTTTGGDPLNGGNAAPAPDSGNTPTPPDGPGFGEKLMEGASDAGAKLISGAKKAAAASGEAISDAVERYAPAAQEMASGIARETKVAFSKGIKPVTVALIGAGLCILWMILPLVLGVPLHLQVIAQVVDSETSQSLDVPQLPVDQTAAPARLPDAAGQIILTQLAPRGEGNVPQRAGDNPPAAAESAPAPVPAKPAAPVDAKPAVPPGGPTAINLKGSDEESKRTYRGQMYEANFRPAKLQDDSKALAIGAIVLGGPIFATGASLTAGSKASLETSTEMVSTTSAILRAKSNLVLGAFFFIILAVLFVICELVIKDYYGMEKVFAAVALVWLLYCYTFGWIAQTMMVAFAKRAGGFQADISGNMASLADAPMRILLAGIVILVFTWLARRALKLRQPA